jgi:hypothetical protein
MLIVAILVIGSINRGIFSGEFPLSDLVAYFFVIFFFYVLIVYLMYVIGGEPSKFEIIFVPTIIIGVTIIGLVLLNLIPEVEPQTPDGSGDTTTTDITSVSSSNSTMGTGSTNPIQSTSINQEVQNLISFSQIALFIILFLVIIGVAVYIYKNRSKFEPEISIAQEIEYSKPKFQSNKDIIQFYIDASQKIEMIKGQAPQWFSPTYFAEHVEYSPGPPLSSYFDRLTTLYEWARFSNLEMSGQDVQEAKDLVFEINNQLEFIKQKIKEASQ